jgi:hypothetical protein
MRSLVLLAGILAAASVSRAEPVTFQVHGQAWTEAGRIMQASDTLSGVDVIKVGGTTMQSIGGQLTVDAQLGEHWDASFGMGVYQLSTSLGTQNDQTYEPNFQVATMFRPYIAQANLTWFLGDRSNPWFSVTGGNFAYNYNTNVKNLGLYLMRGPVYPGLLMSGFQKFETDTTKGIQTGFKIHHAKGNFSHDLMLVQELILPPLFDWSLVYAAQYRTLGGALELGAGANFYRLIPYSKPLETPGHLNEAALTATNYYEIDGSGDTTFFTHQGVKLVGSFALDPKKWLPIGGMGPEDFKLYGEIALLGVENYGTTYDDPLERMPVMIGFNVPTFGWLDVFSVEVEWYGSPYKNDLANIGNPNAVVAPWMSQNTLTPIASPGPVSPGAYADSTADNWKWSVIARKTFAKRVQFTAQVANDHYRAPPLVNISAGIGTTGGTAAVLTSSSDWYFMGRVGFFF